MPVTFSVGRSKAVLRAFNGDMQLLARDLSKRGAFRKPLQESVEKVLIPSIEQNFASGGRPQKWAPTKLPSSYRSTRGQGGPTLWVSGAVKKAASAKARFTIANNQIEYGNWPAGASRPNPRVASQHVGYGPVLDLGLGNVPARPFAVMQDTDIDKMEDIFLNWIENRVNDRIKRRYTFANR